MGRPRDRRWLVASAVLGAFALASCSDGVTEPTLEDVLVDLQVSAAVEGADVSELVIEVTADDLPFALVFNLEVQGGVAEGVIEVPAGPNRLISITAFNADGIETHRGSATVDIQPGENPPLTITLEHLVGDQPIEVVFGGGAVTVTPSSSVIEIGETVQLEATVTDADGNPLDAEVEWATTNPAVATVDEDGTVMGLVPGSASIVAVHQGMAGAAEIVVEGWDEGAALIETDDERIPFILAHEGGEQIAAVVEDGELTAVMYWDGDLEEASQIFMNGEGLPSKVVGNGHIALFENYDLDEGVVDMAVIGPDGEIELLRGIPIPDIDDAALALALSTAASPPGDFIRRGHRAVEITVCAGAALASTGLVATLPACRGVFLDILERVGGVDVSRLRDLDERWSNIQCGTALTFAACKGQIIEGLASAADRIHEELQDREDDIREVETVLVTGYEDLLPLELRRIMEEADMPFHDGTDPPDVQGVYVASPNVVLTTNIPPTHHRYAPPGTRFVDLFVRFSDQRDEDFEIQLATVSMAEESVQETEGTGVLIGEGTRFTVIVETVITDTERGTALGVQVYSGEITPDGIANYHNGIFMRDNFGNEAFIPNNTGRVFWDSSGLAETTTWPGTSPAVEPHAVWESSDALPAVWSSIKEMDR